MPRSSQTVAWERVLQETPVVADQHHGRARGLEHRLQALDTDHVEMVGGLVEQENVGFGRQHAGERGAAGLAAREMRRVLVAGEAEAFQQIARAVRIVARGEPGRDEGGDGGEAGQIRTLRQIADGHRRLQEARAGVRLDHSRGELEQGRLPRPVAADQA